MPQTSPVLPKLPLTLHVGVTGHRPKRLVKAHAQLDLLTAQINHVLQKVDAALTQIATSSRAKAWYSQGKPTLRLLSSLAEGADRIAADCALQAGYQLQYPLPFLEEDYKKDFADEASKAEFDRLLQEAGGRVWEFDNDYEDKTAKPNNGPAQEAEQAVTGKEDSEMNRLGYRQAGRLVLHHADIVLAICDDTVNEISVGAAGMVAEAKRQGLPLIRIDAAAPHKITFWQSKQRSGKWVELTDERLLSVLESILLPEKNDIAEKPSGHFLTKFFPKARIDTYHDFYHDPEPSRIQIGLAYRAFFSFLGKHKLKFWGNPYREDSEVWQWQVITTAAEKRLPNKSIATSNLQKLIGEHFIRADSLATYYADHYRGTFVLSYFFGACAVLFAALGASLQGLPESFGLFSFAELAFILSMIALYFYGQHRRTHQHWLDFRLLAERLRQQAFMLPMGLTSRWFLPDYESHDDTSQTWIDRLIRSLSRYEGLPMGKINADYRQGYRQYLADLIKDQADYHKNNAERNKNIVKFLEFGNIIMLAVVIFACIVHIVCHYFFHHEFAVLLTTLLAIALPAASAALAGILSQGEFERIEHRSAGMEKMLNSLAAEL